MLRDASVVVEPSETARRRPWAHRYVGLMRFTLISDTPSAPEEQPLDAYSRVVTFVAERLSPSVGNLRLSRRVRGGRVYDWSTTAIDGFEAQFLVPGFVAVDLA
jgi:hypothetical protein